MAGVTEAALIFLAAGVIVYKAVLRLIQSAPVEFL